MKHRTEFCPEEVPMRKFKCEAYLYFLHPIDVGPWPSLRCRNLISQHVL